MPAWRGFSIYFMILQFAVIHAFCVYCLVSAVTTFALLAAAIAHVRATSAAAPGPDGLKAVNP